MPAKRDLHAYQGDDYSHVLTFVDDAGAPFPLPGVFEAQIRKRPISPDVLASFVVDVTNQATGVLVLSLPAAVTAALASSAAWDLQRTLDGVVSTLLRGSITVDGEVTR